MTVFAADRSALHATVATCLTPPLLVLALVTLFLLFKVDLLLAHRRLWTCLAKNKGTLATIKLLSRFPTRGKKHQRVLRHQITTYRTLSQLNLGPSLLTAPDGKLYDAYVSFLHPSSGTCEEANFALRVLPEKLEKQHGYALYIRGRDDCPGEGLD